MKQSVYTVSTLVHYLKESLDHDPRVQSVLIKGEISNFTNHRSGHWYFTLKDAKAKISCIMFSSYASRSKILLKEGMKVIVNASLSVYEASGSIQLYVTQVQVDGLGDLYLQFEQVKEVLRKEGLFDIEHKKVLPKYPMRIGIVTAKTSAAIQDVLTTIARRWPVCDVQVYPSLVQGLKASEDIIKKLQQADEDEHDVILLARGGGPIEDLWCFNDEQLARIIYQMHTVVVTGVGHESDTTLVDYVSDARAPTPTAAAELITPDISEVKALLYTNKSRLVKDIQQRIHLYEEQFLRLKEHRYMKNALSYTKESQMKLAMHVRELAIVEHKVKQERSKLSNYSNQLFMISQQFRQKNTNLVNERKQQLQFLMQQVLHDYKKELQQSIGLLDAYSPLKILGRGYNIAYYDEHIVKSIHDVPVDGTLNLRFQDGELETKIIKKESI